jgi:Tfp pilus assembly protein PilN
MLIPINLASQPFRRDRAMLVASVAVSMLLTGTLIVLVILANADKSQLAEIRRENAALTAQLRKVTTEQSRLDTILRQPKNTEVLEESVFLNTLLRRKGISWTRIFADLEKVIPYDVRVIQIRPSVNAQDQVSLDMMVGANSMDQVIGLFESLQKSPIFSYSDVKIVQPPTQADPFFKCRASVEYAQKL